MVNLDDLLRGVGAAAAFAGVGVALLLVGLAVVDLMTPGKLRSQIWEDRNLSATLFTASKLFGIGIITTVSIWVSHDELTKGLIDTVVFGLLGVVLFTVAFFIIDWLTPGDMAAMMVEDHVHPALILAMVTDVVVAVILSVSLVP